MNEDEDEDEKSSQKNRIESRDDHFLATSPLIHSLISYIHHYTSYQYSHLSMYTLVTIRMKLVDSINPQTFVFHSSPSHRHACL